VSMARRSTWVLGILLAAAPRAALACAVCFDPRAENRIAFLATTAFLSFLPLGLVGGLVAWLRQRAKDLGKTAAEGPASSNR
jgi:hypothetical protein